MGVESTISIPIPTGVFKMVDDTDPAVQYNGPWSQDFGTTDSLGNAGSTYNHTTHVIKNNGSLSFTFTGTEFTAAASMTIRDVDAQNDPDWTCSVDGFSLATGGNNGIDDTNRYILCSNDSLALGQHTVSIGVRSLGTPFWFDYIRYMPGPTVSNDSSVLIYDSLNANIQYDGTFLNSPNSGAHMTQTNAGALSVPFNGASISWVGFALQSLPDGAAQAKYSVDLGPAVQFSIPTSDQFQQTYFTTPPVENGPHTLVVTYEGNGQTTPLMLDYFLVSTGPNIPDNTLGSSNASVVVGSGATPPGTSTSTGSGPGPGTSQAQHDGVGGNSGGTDTPQTKVVTNIGAIVGGVAGGAAFALLAVLAVFFIRRRRHRKENQSGSEALYHSVAQAQMQGRPDRIVPASGRVTVPMLHVEPWVLPQQWVQTQDSSSTGSGPTLTSQGVTEGSRASHTTVDAAAGTKGTAPPGYSP